MEISPRPWCTRICQRFAELGPPKFRWPLGGDSEVDQSVMWYRHGPSNRICHFDPVWVLKCIEANNIMIFMILWQQMVFSTTIIFMIIVRNIESILGIEPSWWFRGGCLTHTHTHMSVCQYANQIEDPMNRAIPESCRPSGVFWGHLVQTAPFFSGLFAGPHFG